MWAGGTALPGARKTTPGRVGEAMVVRRAEVAPGDWVVADADGVVIVPAGTLDSVISAGRARADKEATMFEELQAGRTTVELLGLDTAP